MIDTLGDALPREMARVRDEVMPAYMETGEQGAFALGLMRCALDGAAKALAEGNIIDMMRWYEELKGFHT